jgi:heptose I phosphotransferase
MIVLPETWVQKLGSKDIFKELFSLEGRVLREQEGRRTLHFSFGEKSYYGKFHNGVGWKEIFKNLFQLRQPVIGAQNEWKAIKKVELLGLKSMNIVGYGKKGLNPARVKSFLVTDELTGTISLENFCRGWPESPPDTNLKRILINEIAKIARVLHENGMNHRDFYLCHLLLDATTLRSDNSTVISPFLYLIDLHRAQIRRKTPLRWKIKDLAGLYFSSMDIGLTRSDVFRFMKAYRKKTLRKTLAEDNAMWLKAKRRAESLYMKTWKKAPLHPFKEPESHSAV